MKKELLFGLFIFFIFIAGCAEVGQDVQKIEYFSATPRNNLVNDIPEIKEEYFLIEIFQGKNINYLEFKINSESFVLLDFQNKANEKIQVFIDIPGNAIDLNLNPNSKYIEALSNLKKGTYDIELNGFVAGKIIVE